MKNKKQKESKKQEDIVIGFRSPTEIVDFCLAFSKEAGLNPEETMHLIIRMCVDAEIEIDKSLSSEDVFAEFAKLNRPLPGMPEISEQTLYEQIKEAYYYTPEQKRLKTK